MEGTITQSVNALHFELTTTAAGTLVARLSWDPWYNGTLLLLKVGDTEFRPRSPDWSPVVARAPVSAGERYRLVVALAGSDWIPDDRFTLTTAIE